MSNNKKNSFYIQGTILAAASILTRIMGIAFRIPDMIITGILTIIMVCWPKVGKKKLSPIALILCSAALGIIVFGI